jgi:hypothetical protein
MRLVQRRKRETSGERRKKHNALFFDNCENVIGGNFRSAVIGRTLDQFNRVQNVSREQDNANSYVEK